MKRNVRRIRAVCEFASHFIYLLFIRSAGRGKPLPYVHIYSKSFHLELLSYILAPAAVPLAFDALPAAEDMLAVWVTIQDVRALRAEVHHPGRRGDICAAALVTGAGEIGLFVPILAHSDPSQVS